TSGVADRTPAWSPDGRWVSYFTDASGEYQLVIAPQDGLGERRVIDLPDPKFYYTPSWSPDSRRIVFTDTDLRLWVVDVESGRATHVYTDTYMVPHRSVDPVWSPDSRWIAYAKRLPNLLHAIFVYSVEDGSIHQVTDGYSDALSPAWDASGKYLYFLASTDFGLNTGWLDMTSYDRPSTRGIYLAVLQDDEPSPFLPKPGDEPARDTASSGGSGNNQGERNQGRGARSNVRVDIDFDGL